MSNFQRRALTATIFTAVMLAGLFFNKWSFFILFGVIATGCLWEFLGLTLTDEQHKKQRQILGTVLGVAAYVVAFVNFENFASLLINMNICLVLALSILIFQMFLPTEKPFEFPAFLTLGFVYLIAPFSFVCQVLGHWKLDDFTPNIVAGILFLTWINDVGAYLIGSTMGKTPLFPRISPKKTWEGTVGGAVLCIAAGFVIFKIFGILTLVDWFVIGGIVAVFGTLGDLVESMLKRSVGVKDSGDFMPGHGGFLDRFDAFIFEIPFVFLYLLLK